MKFKAVLAAALFALGVTAAVAVAKPPGKGKPKSVAAKIAARSAHARGEEMNHCRGGHMNLHGDLLSVDLENSEFTLHVIRANKKGRSLVDTDVTIVVGDKTKMRRHGKSSLDKLVVGDRLLVLVRRCRDEDGDKALLAKQVVVLRWKGHGDETTSTSTSTSNETETDDTSTETETETETTSTETETTSTEADTTP